MRQGQQNRRGRGRNRKSQNPMTRSFESTGPDVKIRGTAAHVAEKYMSLARDASSSGDPVLAENYLQHAEHYNRIIMAFREQNMGPGGDPNGALMRPVGGPESMDGDDYDDDGDDQGFDGPSGYANGDSQPVVNPPRSFEGQQRYDNRPQRNDRNDHQRNDHQRNSGQQRFDRNDRDRDNRGNNRNNGEHRQDYRRNEQRGDGRQDFRQDRDNRDRGGDRGYDRRPDRDRGFDRGGEYAPDRQNDRMPDRQQDRQPLPRSAVEPQPQTFRDEVPFVQPMAPPPAAVPVPQSIEAPADVAAVAPAPRRGRFAQSAAPAPQHEQPEFLRRPVRRPRREAAPAEEAASPAAPAITDEAE